MKWLKFAAYGFLILLTASVPAYWWMFVETHPASPGTYTLDIAKVRQLASALPGSRPIGVRVETIAQLSGPATFVVAGDGWQSTVLPVLSFELLYPHQTLIIDTGFNAASAKAMGAQSHDAAAYSRMSAALSRASLIVVTHEHPDHVGGLLAQPNAKSLLSVTRLTQEQVAALKPNLTAGAFKPLHLASTFFDDYKPIAYGRYLSVAPGVVLIKAPGHTPGSQMIYVRRADGVEFLFVGDVAWHLRNVETGREKARVVAWLTGENRAQVRDELAALKTVHAQHPELHMIPGHDFEAVRSLVNKGLVARGF